MSHPLPHERRRLSVAMIVRDAGEILEATLESIQGIADELVIVDTGSIDQTPEIAARYRARVHKRPWDDDFAAARNYALDRTTGDWVLWLDAGEHLTAESAAELRSFVDRQADPGNVYMLLIKLPPHGATVSGEQVGRVRLIPRKPGLKFSGRIRENLRQGLAALGITVEGLPFHILRSQRDHDPQVKHARAQRDLKLADLELRNGGSQGAMLTLTGDAFATLGNTPAAIDCYRRALQHCPRGSTEMLEAYYGLLTALDSEPSNKQTQLAVCLEALEVFPFDAQLLCAMGSYLQAEGRLDLAARAYQTAVNYGQVNPETWHLSAVAEVALVCYSLSLQLLDRDAEAQQALEGWLAQWESSARVRRHLIDLHIKHGRRKEALEQVDRLRHESSNREGLRSAVRGACLAAQQNWILAKNYLQTAYDAGCRDTLCLRWLAVTLLSIGDVDAARPILDQWQQQDPLNMELLRYQEAIAQGTLQPNLPAFRSAGDGSLDEAQFRVDGPAGSDGRAYPCPNVAPAAPVQGLPNSAFR